MGSVTSDQLLAAAPNGRREIVDAIASKSAELFPKYGITNRNRALGFLSTAMEETGGFRAVVEDLYYTAERLRDVWPLKFRTVQAAQPYARRPATLANYVYGGRMGNVGPNDGWNYRGRGPIQCTGLNNYALVEKLTGLPALANPDLVADPAHMLECALALFTRYPGILEHCDRREWLPVWNLVATGDEHKQTINLPAHQTALSRLNVALPTWDGAIEPMPAPAPPAPLPRPAPASAAPVSAAPPSQGWLSRLWAALRAAT